MTIEAANPDQPKSVTFNYIKSNQFRVIHADGGIGGVTPTGLIHFAIYNERPALPQQATHTISGEGALSDNPDALVTKGGIVREVEVDLMMNLQTAKSMKNWLDRNIAMLEQSTEQTQ